MMLIQAVPPVPPPVPTIPLDPNGMSTGGIVMVVLLVTAAITIICWPIVRALARRLEGRAGLSPALQEDLEDMHHRLAELDGLQQRVSELEERLDFAERMLAQPREPDRLPR
jgi:Tfp pilus assembly protein PilO